MSLITLPATIRLSANQVAMAFVRSQEIQKHTSGASQITSFPDAHWEAQINIVPQFDADLRAWSLALEQLSDRANWFALTPAEYGGPSTGYAGPGPLVNGASQTGLTLNVDGLTPSAAILSAGDFLSFDVTTAKGNTNRQLIRVAADMTANASGQAAISLVQAIRLSPADNAAVEIFSPSALMMLAAAQSTVTLQPPMYSAFTIQAVEKISL